MSYHLGALSLREHLPASVPAVVVERGEIVVAAVASAWGAWSGLDAEVPAVEAAYVLSARDLNLGAQSALGKALRRLSRAVEAGPDEQLHVGQIRDDLPDKMQSSLSGNRDN